LTIYLDPHRTRIANLLSKLQHLLAGIPLLYIGSQKLANNSPEPAVAALELGIGLAVCLTFLHELRAELRHSRAAHSRFGWFELAAGMLLIFESFHGATTKPGYLRPSFLAGTVTVGLGLFHKRLQARAQRRRYLKLDDDGFELRASRFRRTRLQWVELASIDLKGSKITFHQKTGGHRSIHWRLFRNGDEIRTAIMQHPAAAGLLTKPQPTVETPPPATESATSAFPSLRP
jgi:hypothetical protein